MSRELQGIFHNFLEHLRGIKVIGKAVIIKARRCFQPFLAACALYSAVPGAKVDPLPVATADQLHFQMVVVSQALFNQHAFIAELTLCVIFYLSVDPSELLDFMDFLNAHSAAAGCGLNQYRRHYNILIKLKIKQP